MEGPSVLYQFRLSTIIIVVVSTINHNYSTNQLTVMLMLSYAMLNEDRSSTVKTTVNYYR